MPTKFACVVGASRAAVRRGRGFGQRRRACRLAARGGQRSRQPAVTAAWRAQLHGLLLGLPFAASSCVTRASPKISRSPTSCATSYLVRPGDKFSDYIEPSMPAAGRAGMVRQAAAGPVAGRAFARHRLGVQLPDDFLCGSGQPPDRREQPAVAGHRDAARARERAGRAERRVATTSSTRVKTASRS